MIWLGSNAPILKISQVLITVLWSWGVQKICDVTQSINFIFISKSQAYQCRLNHADRIFSQETIITLHHERQFDSFPKFMILTLFQRSDCILLKVLGREFYASKSQVNRILYSVKVWSIRKILQNKNNLGLRGPSASTGLNPLTNAFGST